MTKYKYKCIHCRKWKPLDAEHFYREFFNTTGYKHTCIECTKEAARRAYWLANGAHKKRKYRLLRNQP